MSNIPSYLWLSRHSVFYFRIVVPDIIRPHFPQREIRRSLQTRCKREALIRGREVLAQVQRMFTQAFQGLQPAMGGLWGSWEGNGKRLASWANWLSPERTVISLETPESPRRVAPVVISAPVAVSAVQAEDIGAKRFMEVVEEQLAEQKREGVSQKGLDDKRAVALLLTRIIGDKPISAVSRKDAHQFRETALKLPPRLHQLPEMPLEKIIAQAKTTISVTTFNNYIKNLCSGQLIPDTELSFSSATAGASPSLN